MHAFEKTKLQYNKKWSHSNEACLQFSCRQKFEIDRFLDLGSFQTELGPLTLDRAPSIPAFVVHIQSIVIGKLRLDKNGFGLKTPIMRYEIL